MARRLALIEIFRKARARIEARIAALLLHYARAEAELLSTMLAAMASEKVVVLRERRRQEAHARQILRTLDETTRAVVPEIVNQSFQVGQNLVDASLGSKAPELSRVNRNAMKLLTENLIEDLGQATQHVGRRIEDAFRKEALRVAFSDVPGERPRAVGVADMRRSLEQQGIVSFIDRSGRKWTLQNYAKMAAHTVTQEAINVSEANLLEARGIDLVTFNKSPKCCDKCKEYDGKTYSLTGRAKGYPVLKKRAPFHPLCEHIAFPSPDAMRERRESGWEPSIAPAHEMVTA